MSTSYPWHVVMTDRFPWTRNQFTGDAETIMAAIERWENEIDEDLPHSHQSTAEEIALAIRYGSRSGIKGSDDNISPADIACWIRQMRSDASTRDRQAKAEKPVDSMTPDQVSKAKAEWLSAVRGWLASNGKPEAKDGMRRLERGEKILPTDIIELADGTRKTWGEHVAVTKHIVAVVNCMIVIYRKVA